jgi:transcriptional regulator GlxA family with amidase domain
MVHLHRIRLRHAKAMLSQPDAGTSVTKVGFLCGFSNLEHFAMKYQSVFGEKPSETLRNSQR